MDEIGVNLVAMVGLKSGVLVQVTGMKGQQRTVLSEGGVAEAATVAGRVADWLVVDLRVAGSPSSPTFYSNHALSSFGCRGSKTRGRLVFGRDRGSELGGYGRVEVGSHSSGHRLEGATTNRLVGGRRSRSRDRCRASCGLARGGSTGRGSAIAPHL